MAGLVEVGRPHVELDADVREQLAPPRRSRGEDQARDHGGHALF
jgi:hypothetical protein